jgi:hypothetical protein
MGMICLSSPAACPPIYISHGYRRTKARYYLKTPAKKKKKGAKSRNMDFLAQTKKNKM